jgi:hypothetical protein
LPDTFDIEKIAFSFEEFNSRQYMLAPNRGVTTGSGLEASYPRATISGSSIPSGSFLSFDGADHTEHTYADGFVFASCFAKAENLNGEVTLQILSGDQEITRVTLTPDQPSALKTIINAVKPEPLRIRVVNAVRSNGTATITVEATELLEYKPNRWDAYLVLRTSATKGGFEDQGTPLDGAGIDQAEATQLYKNYLANGCIVNSSTRLASDHKTTSSTRTRFMTQRAVFRAK